MLASALLLAAGAAGSSAAVAADDPNLVQLHSACHQALSLASDAARQLGGNATAADARRTLGAVTRAETWNNQACATMASRTPEDNAVRKQMHDVNAAFLQSLRAQADTVLHSRYEAADYALATRRLDACLASATLPGEVKRACQTQLGYNDETRRRGAGSAGNNACGAAVVAANDAGTALKAKDYASFERAYQRVTDGLAANRNCKGDTQMHDVNNAYLLTWKTVADRYLDIPFTDDRDIPNAANPFGVPNDILGKCSSWGPPFPAQSMRDCATQLTTNQRFLTDYAAPTPLSPGQIARPLAASPVDWPYAVRPDFVWDGACKNAENKACADEEVRDGTPPNGWALAASGVATPLDDQRERVLFATIRNCDDLHRLFSGQPPQIGCDFFKSNILLVAAQRKPHQQCNMTVTNVQSISTPATTFTPRDAVRVDYTLKCAPPVPGSSGNVVTRVVSIPAGNANGQFGSVTFIEPNGGGPRGGTY